MELRKFTYEEMCDLHSALRDDMDVDKVRKWSVILRKAVLDGYLTNCETVLGIKITGKERKDTLAHFYRVLMFNPN